MWLVMVIVAIGLAVAFNVVLFQATDFKGLPDEVETQYRAWMLSPFVVYVVSIIAWMLHRKRNDH
jgi:hypothetical protein